MTTPERLQLIRLLDRIRSNPGYAVKAGVRDASYIKEKRNKNV